MLRRSLDRLWTSAVAPAAWERDGDYVIIGACACLPSTQHLPWQDERLLNHLCNLDLYLYSLPETLLRMNEENFCSDIANATEHGVMCVSL